MLEPLIENTPSLGAVAVMAVAGLLLVCTRVLLTALNKVLDGNSEHGERLVRIETTLTGISGDNGLVGDIKATRQSLHDLRTDVQVLENWKYASEQQRRTQ